MPAVAAIPWDLVVSAAGGILAALLGVLVGGAVTSRTQRQHWLLTTQVQACVDLYRQSTVVKTQLAQIAREGRRRDRPEDPPLLNWDPWNEHLGVVCMVTEPRIVQAAQRMDALFWEAHLQAKNGGLVGEAWLAAAGQIDDVRLAYLNTVRRHLLGRRTPLGWPDWTGRPPRDHPIWRDAWKPGISPPASSVEEHGPS